MVEIVANTCWGLGFFIAGMLLGPIMLTGMPTAEQVFGLSIAGACLIALALVLDIMRNNR